GSGGGGGGMYGCGGGASCARIAAGLARETSRVIADCGSRAAGNVEVSARLSDGEDAAMFPSKLLD
ncbi:MAG TPA: hypothetical protein VK524_15700, partial [Polyangiaceae bacterium]|nr:hypothetical protein [Polyangiaceae bacterium]